MTSIPDCFKLAGVDFDEFEKTRRDYALWNRLFKKETQYKIYQRWHIGAHADPAGYLQYWPNDPNPQPLTKTEQQELDALKDRYPGKQSGSGFWDLFYREQSMRHKLMKKSPLMLNLVEQSDAYLKQNGWVWPLQVKELIGQGWIMSEIRVKFVKNKRVFVPGDIFRLHASGFQSSLHRVIDMTEGSIVYEPAGFVNYGFMLIKPRSKRPTTEYLTSFANRECVPLDVVQAA
jgi:hypothetical protein